METLIRKTRLWFCEGSSDKVYIAEVVQRGDGYYEVRGHWGRRGKTMQSQVKSVHVTEWQATAAYQGLVSQKVEKGYRVTDRTAFA